VSQRKEYIGYDPKTKEVHWSDGTKSVFTDKNGNPVVPEKFLKKKLDDQLEQALLEMENDKMDLDTESFKF
jgi:hypothetical protein